jgi:hypothetical protein
LNNTVTGVSAAAAAPALRRPWAIPEKDAI